MNCPQIKPLLYKVMTNVVCSSNAPDSTATLSISLQILIGGGLWHHRRDRRPLLASPVLLVVEPALGSPRADQLGKVGPFPLSRLLCVLLAPHRPHHQLFALPAHWRARGGHRAGELRRFQPLSSSLLRGGHKRSISPALERDVVERKVGPVQMFRSQDTMITSNSCEQTSI